MLAALLVVLLVVLLSALVVLLVVWFWSLLVLDVLRHQLGRGISPPPLFPLLPRVDCRIPVLGLKVVHISSFLVPNFSA